MTTVSAGCSVSTILPTMDFETYSEAGYYYDKTTDRWCGITKTKPGIAAVGAAVYAEHPSTRVLSLAYDLKDGLNPRLWTPDMILPPFDLFVYIENGGLIEAHNSMFEYLIWINVCQKKMGWPILRQSQLRCSMSKARAFSLPGSLNNAAKALGSPEQKDPAGELVLRKLSIPHSPTKKQLATGASTARTPQTHPEEFSKLYAYNKQDLKAESAVSERCPDLSPTELKLWITDQAINYRGVYIDKAALNNCVSIVKQATDKYTWELRSITGGTANSVGELEKIQGWLGANGCYTPNLDADAVETALKRTDISPACRRVLEIRSTLGAASVKKLFAIERTLCSDSRLRDLFAYCGADRTGRWAGRGAQPQNMPSSGPKVAKCKQCGTVSWIKLSACPVCLQPRSSDDACDWGIGAIERALQDIATRDMLYVERQWGDAIAAVSGCLRGLFAAAPGKDLVCSDYSAIEAVVLAEVSGEEWRQDVFRTHGKIYEMSASKISGISFDEFLAHKKRTGQHHPLRKKVGKVAELACFSPGTQVLTRNGLKAIELIDKHDLLWDGVAWVKSQGAIHKGKRKVLNLDGVNVTPEHPISLGTFWREARILASKKNILRRALEFASENIPSYSMKKEEIRGGQDAYALAGSSNLWTFATYIAEKLRAAVSVAALRLKKHGLNYTRSMRTSSRILGTEADLSTGSEPLSRAATLQPTSNTIITGGAGSRYSPNGVQRTELVNSCSTFSRLKAGITRFLRWTGLIQTEITNLGTYALSQNAKTRSIKDPFPKCNVESMNLSDVYDIAHAGPRNRFTIKTNSGWLIVHNSGYGGALSAWKAFGAHEFMGDDEIITNVKAWRKASPSIPKFWYGIQEAAHRAVTCPGSCFSYQAPATKFTQPPAFAFGVKDNILYCQLPSGRLLCYHQPRLEQTTGYNGRPELQLTYMGWNSNYLAGPTGWTRLDTWGGKLTENIVQAVSRDLLAHALPALEAAGYPVVLHVHDEIVSEVPEESGSVQEFESIMSATPPWADKWPIKAAGGWRGKRYRKE